jgi:EAL domain-containing protein (putative c-di-GMP-specific phosphodiesterase class I)
MGHQLGLKIIAEGIETVEQLDHLKRLSCDQVQGYFITRPLPADELGERFLRVDGAFSPLPPGERVGVRGCCRQSRSL